jgi:hypothetical protein
VIDLNRGFARYLQERGDRNPNEHAGERLSPDLKSFIEIGAIALKNAQRVINHFVGIDCDNGGELSKVVHSRSRVKLHAPWPERRIACVGGNYAAHLVGMWANRLAGPTLRLKKLPVSEEGRKMGFLESAGRDCRTGTSYSVSQACHLLRL